jgi:Tfp pilus assembly protein PilX
MSQAKQQHGSTLIVALIMLVLLTLVAVSSMNSTNMSLQVVGNAQFREEASAAAQQAIEQVMSTNFPAAPVVTPISVDINNDTVPDYVGQADAPTCTSSISLTNNQLNAANPADQTCLSTGQALNTGIIGASGVMAVSQSWCFRQTWDIRSVAADSNTGANATVHQGIFVRVPTGTACP